MTVSVVATVVALVAGAAWWLLRDDRSRYDAALDTLPAATLRAAFTDWAHARATIDDRDLQTFVDDAYDADLTRSSALESSAVALEANYGIDLSAAEWEVYGQSDAGSVAVVQLDTSYPRLRDTLEDLGYGKPSSSERAWTADPSLVAGVDPSLSPVLQNIVLLDDAQLVLLSDDGTYAERAARVAKGDTESLLDRVDDLAGEAVSPVSAVLWGGDFACGALSMASADDADQNHAEQLVADVGGVDPVDGLVMAREADGQVRVVMMFASDDQARANLQPRTDLAAGEAPGLGGRFDERFEITGAEREGRFVVLRLRPAEDEESLLSVLSNGPTLFATC